MALSLNFNFWLHFQTKENLYQSILSMHQLNSLFGYSIITKICEPPVNILMEMNGRKRFVKLYN